MYQNESSMLIKDKGLFTIDELWLDIKKRACNVNKVSMEKFELVFVDVEDFALENKPNFSSCIYTLFNRGTKEIIKGSVLINRCRPIPKILQATC
ncbi:hypothetical protein ABC382_00635 [Lysinibacillus sp. 1P01SD]|uniref:hypothetical protein n=1 Tax=Lysinibacillus sp. 1P01SD TaxID=3132285 RepID=UPI0039A2E8E7